MKILYRILHLNNVAEDLFVLSIHNKLVSSSVGTLSEWAPGYSRYRKQLLWLLQKPVLEVAELLHAMSNAENIDIRRVGLEQPVLPPATCA